VESLLKRSKENKNSTYITEPSSPLFLPAKLKLEREVSVEAAHFLRGPRCKTREPAADRPDELDIVRWSGGRRGWGDGGISVETRLDKVK
jgi:hypothetical protein